jgi:methyl-accepting chemotaxis protein
MILSDKATDQQKFASEILKSRVAISAAIESSKKMLERDSEANLLGKFEVYFAKYNQTLDQIVTRYHAHQLTKQEAIEWIDSSDYKKTIDIADDTLSQIANQEAQSANQATLDATTLYHQSLIITITFISGSIIAGLFFALMIAWSIRRPSSRLQAAVKEIAKGELDTEVPHTDYPNEIGELAISIGVLQSSAQKMEEQRWVKAHLGDISNAVQHALSFDMLAKEMLSNIAPLLHIGRAAFYVNESDHLNLIGTYGDGEVKKRLAFGEGLVGQCAIDKVAIHLTKVPADYGPIHSCQ